MGKQQLWELQRKKLLSQTASNHLDSSTHAMFLCINIGC
jgi:hypothetical protein